MSHIIAIVIVVIIVIVIVIAIKVVYEAKKQMDKNGL